MLNGKPRKRGFLKALLPGLRLIGWSPALLVQTGKAYRGFRRQYIKHATEQGMPIKAARQLAREMRPFAILKGLRKRS